MIPDGVKRYRKFHRLMPEEIGEFAPSLRIPRRIRRAGEARYVLYRSCKLDPVTRRRPRAPVDYIHEHKRGVGLYRPKLRQGRVSVVPSWLHEVTTMVRLGECLGFGYESPDGKMVEAEGVAPYPVLYCIPSGRALAVIEKKRHLLALLWGGALGVEGRGVVG